MVAKSPASQFFIMGSLRLLLADDQTIALTGLRKLLESLEGIEIVGEARDGGEAIDLAAKLQPDVILMDLRMPGVTDIEATPTPVSQNLGLWPLALGMRLR